MTTALAGRQASDRRRQADRTDEGTPVRTASALRRACAYPNVLAQLSPKTAKERAVRERRDAAAVKGTMFHEAVYTWPFPEVSDDEVRGWLDLLAASGWRPRAGMLFEAPLGLTIDGRGIPCSEPQPHVYTAADGSELLTAGRADVVWSDIIDGRLIVTVRDWKTGRYAADPAERNLQTTALGMAGCLLGNADGYRRELYYVRDGYLDADPEPIMKGTEAWQRNADDVWAAAKLDDQPHPGEVCRNCWERRKRTCPVAQEGFDT